MAQEVFQKVAYIGLRNADGSLMLNVPLYVKVSELNKNGMTDTQEKVLHRIYLQCQTDHSGIRVSRVVYPAALSSAQRR